MAAIQYHQFPGTTVTVACVLLKNGYAVVGKSACASLENFDVELGRKIAVDDAKRQLWPILGYALLEELARQPAMDGGYRDSGNPGCGEMETASWS